MKRPVISLLCIVLFASAGFGQSLTTGKKYVTAIVDPGQGWVQVKLFPGRQQDGTLSYSKKSFVTFLVNGTYYTNNDVGLTPFPVNAKLLNDGVLSKTGDTVRCVWPNKGGVDLIEEVYPVLLGRSEQIVFRWKALNKGSTAIPVSVQYLLDVQVGDQDYTNDGAPVMTRYGYRPLWQQFSDTSVFGIPWFFIAFQHVLPSEPTFDPGISGQGYLDNVNINLGLTKPWRQTIGDWNQLIQHVWGPPAPFPSGIYNDAAILLEFNIGTALPGKETQIARMSYGTGEFVTCKGQMFGVLFYPENVGSNVNPLIANPFRTEMYLFNPQSVTGAPNTSITLNVGPNLQIMSPIPITNGGKTQVQDIGTVPPLDMRSASWTLEYDTIGITGNSLLSSVKFHVVSPGLGYPIFINDSDGSDTCGHPLTIQVALKGGDFAKPLTTAITKVDSFTKIFTVSDNGTSDTGLDSVKWKFEKGTDPGNFVVNINPPLTHCSKVSHTVSVTRIDSTKGGCLDFTFKDCSANLSTLTVCFDSLVIPVKRDTVPPSIDSDIVLATTLRKIVISDNRLLDSGLKSVKVLESTLDSFVVNVSPPILSCSKDRHSIYVLLVSSRLGGCVTLEIKDCADNVTLDSVCFITDSTSGVINERINSFSFDITPNPSRERITLLFNTEGSSLVTSQIIDVLGHIVKAQSMMAQAGTSEMEIDLAGIPAGSYIVRAESNGQVASHILKIVR